MSRKPTRNDVAKLAEVSVATVSYVINNSPKPISAETKNRVLEAVAKLNYQPDLIARSLKTGKTYVIGLVIPSIASPFLADLANIVHEALLEHDYTVTMTNTREDQKVENQVLDLLNSQSVDGLIVCPASFNTIPNNLIRQRERAVPIVFMDRYISGFEADAVFTDNVKVTQQATDYLIQQGCRQILCISFSRTASSGLDRVKGFRRSLVKHELGFDEQQVMVVEDPTGVLAEAAILGHVDAHGVPDGIICTTQEIGISVVKAFKRRAINYPAQRLVVFDADWAKLLDPPLPMVKQNSQDIAQTAVRLLLDRLNGESAPYRTVYVDAQLVIS